MVTVGPSDPIIFGCAKRLAGDSPDPCGGIPRKSDLIAVFSRYSEQVFIRDKFRYFQELPLMARVCSKPHAGIELLNEHFYMEGSNSVSESELVNARRGKLWRYGGGGGIDSLLRSPPFRGADQAGVLHRRQASACRTTILKRGPESASRSPKYKKAPREDLFVFGGGGGIRTHGGR